MKCWIFVASSALFVAGCGGAAVTNNAADNSAYEVTIRNASSALAPAANVAIGRWVREAGRCDEMADVEFTAAGVRMFGGPDGSSMDIPLTYSGATATSVTMQAEPGQPTMVATLRDPTHLELTSPGRPERNCTLVRR